MLFATKAKVHAALIDLCARSARIELKVNQLKSQMADGDKLFGPATEIDEFAQEMSDTSQALALFAVALKQDQVGARQVARKLAEFNEYVERQERVITTAQRSYAAAQNGQF